MKVRKLILILLINITLLPIKGWGQKLSYDTPQNVYAGSPVREVYELNKTASQQYDINRSNYNQIINFLNTKMAESTLDLDKQAIKFALDEFNKALKKYIDGGNWGDAYYYEMETAKTKINENYNAYLNKSMADFVAKALSDSSKTPEEYYNNGNLKMKSNNFKMAIQDYNKAIELNPKYTNAYKDRALSKSYLGDYYGAIRDYDRIIELNPEDDEAYNDRGNSKAQLENYKEAIQDYNKAAELNPKRASIYMGRGFSKLLLNDKKGACMDWSKAGELGDMRAYDMINKHCK